MRCRLTREEKTGKIRRVLILRPDHIGDVVLFSGALRYIRMFYPHAEIQLCIKRYACNLLEKCPYVDRILVWEDVCYNLRQRPTLDNLAEFRGRWLLQTILRYSTRKITKYRYSTDVLLLPVRSPTKKMHWILREIPAKYKFGIAGDFCNQSEECDHEANFFYTRRMQLDPAKLQSHELLTTCDFLHFLGIKVAVEDIWPKFWTDESDKKWADKAIPESKSSVLLALCPGALSKGKFYSPEKYAFVFSALSKIDFHVVIFGDDVEKTQCEQVSQAIKGCKNVISIINLAGHSTIRQLIEGLKRCQVVLSVDTASLHIGVALRKRTVGIIGGGHYGRFYPWGDEAINRTAKKDMDCYWCDWKCRFPAVRCIQDIPPDVVAAELRSVIP